ncbi:MAG: EamA family transporter [Proteobacteria bacterium]|nr:EamA family transporter [Pseudomonadota bacterium]
MGWPFRIFPLRERREGEIACRLLRKETKKRGQPLRRSDRSCCGARAASASPGGARLLGPMSYLTLMTAFHFTLCALMAAAVAAIRGEWQNLPPIGAEAFFWILFGGIGPVGLAYHWWEIGVKRGHVPLISTLAYFIPIGSTLLIGILFRKAMGPGLLFGSVLIAAGAWLAGRTQGSKE